jgi:hypothetical protein
MNIETVSMLLQIAILGSTTIAALYYAVHTWTWKYAWTQSVLERTVWSASFIAVLGITWTVWWCMVN